MNTRDKRLALGIDIGTTNVKAAVLEPGAPPHVLARASAPHPTRRPAPGWSEARARVGSPDESRATEISWDASFFRHLWLTTVTGEVGIDLCVLLEPSTTRPYRMSEAVPNGEALRLAAGECVSFWVELESADRVRA